MPAADASFSHARGSGEPCRRRSRQTTIELTLGRAMSGSRTGRHGTMLRHGVGHHSQTGECSLDLSSCVQHPGGQFTHDLGGDRGGETGRIARRVELDDVATE